jgi:hypothetical protein
MSDDDELQARLRAADPAADLAPADPDGVVRLVADVTSTELTSENRATGTHGRSRLTWLVAAAAVGAIAIGSVFAVRAWRDDEPAPTAGDYSATKLITFLTVPSTPAARCAMPSAELLSSADVAVDGTVAALEDGSATIKPEHWYAGTPTDDLYVQAPTPELERLLGATDLRVGGRYLLAANQDVLMVCGLSGPYDERLAALYAEAFEG